MDSVNMHEAKTNLSRLVELAAAGQEIIISKAGKPVAKLSPLGMSRKPRTFGSMKGKVFVADGFDDPLPPDSLTAFTGDR